nr:hypothetical protein [Tanacetum cinerariifolium]
RGRVDQRRHHRDQHTEPGRRRQPEVNAGRLHPPGTSGGALAASGGDVPHLTTPTSAQSTPLWERIHSRNVVASAADVSADGLHRE